MHRKEIAVLMWIAVSLTAACSLSNIGGLRDSREVTVQMENVEVRPGCRYWYLNQENNPFGVAGLYREYRLVDDPMWQAVAPDSAAFRKVVGLVQSFPVPGSYASGYVIVDPQGKPIGVWYSSLAVGITVDPQTKTVSISSAMPWVFNDEF